MSENDVTKDNNNLNYNGSTKDNIGQKDSSIKIIKEIGMREQIESHQKEAFAVNNMENKNDCLIDGRHVKEHINNNINTISGFKDSFQEKYNSNDKIKRSNGILPDKEFLTRNSLLTDLFEVKHIRTIYNVFITMLIILFFKTLTHDFVASGTINLSLGLIKEGFAKFDIALLIWCGMQAATLLFFYCYKYWAIFRLQLILNKHDYICKMWNTMCLIGFVLYQLFFAYYTIKYVLQYNLQIASSMAVLMEMTRFMMKNHAFVRTNVPKNFSNSIDKIKSNDEDKTSTLIFIPNYKNYVYFLFAPTLIYRDNYPRTKTIRWNIVLWHFLEVIGVIFYISFLIEHYFMDAYKNFGKIQMPASEFVLAIFGSMLPGLIIFVCTFYCILHAWMNAAAELCKFGDRMFYQDWWNATTYSTYYRCWNIVVHDWLFIYVYKDIYDNVFRKNKTIAAFFVFTISAIVHEIILGVTFRFFYPVMYTFFGIFGFSFLFISKKQKQQNNIGNILVWLSFFIGNGVMISLYAIECYARINCENTINIVNSDGIWKYIIPWSWNCNNISMDPNWEFKSFTLNTCY